MGYYYLKNILDYGTSEVSLDGVNFENSSNVFCRKLSFLCKLHVSGCLLQFCLFFRSTTSAGIDLMTSIR
jgi:hypothetical protein